MAEKLSELLGRIDIVEKRGPDPLIRGLAYDSREVRGDFLFFALGGIHADGHRFIDVAIKAGAAAIMHSQPLPRYEDGVAYIRVADCRLCMSPVAAAFHGRPSASLAVIGVTGTEGKSTTVYLIYQLLNLAGKKAGFFSTVMSDSGAGERSNPEHQTTPEATAVQRMLAEMRDAGLEYAVVEASSHGLSKKNSRLADVDFDAAVMMNVTSEHLEFHGNWECYRDDKANLFRALDQPCPAKTKRTRRFGLVNADDPSAAYFRAATTSKVFSFSVVEARGDKDSCAVDLRAESIRVDEAGESFTLIERRGENADTASERRYEARIELPGAFNVANALAALLAVSRLACVDMEKLVPLLPRLKPVRGRMTRIERGQPFELIVDYAHTPSSFETIFPPLRKRVAGKLISVFGSGGERDREKRPRQGRIAARYCDVVILADEDPRGEDSMSLLEEIAAGCPELVRGERLYLIPDRPSAIRKALALAGPGDLVALLGKGHENSILFKDRAMPYDEIAEAEAALAQLGYHQGAQGLRRLFEKG